MHSPAKEKLHPLESYCALIDKSLGNRYHPSIFLTLRSHWGVLRVDRSRVRGSVFPLEELLVDPDKAERTVEEFTADFSDRSVLRTSRHRLRVLILRFGLDDQIAKSTSEIQSRMFIRPKPASELERRAFLDVVEYLKRKLNLNNLPEADPNKEISLALRDYLLQR